MAWIMDTYSMQQRLLDPGRRHRQADRHRRLARPRQGDGARLPVRRRRSACKESGIAIRRRARRDPGLRQRRLARGRTHGGRRLQDRRGLRQPRRRREREGARRQQARSRTKQETGIGHRLLRRRRSVSNKEVLEYDCDVLDPGGARKGDHRRERAAHQSEDHRRSGERADPAGSRRHPASTAASWCCPTSSRTPAA